MSEELGLLAFWMNAFDRETGSQPDEDFNRALVGHHIETEQLFVWDVDDAPVASTARFAEVGGVEELKFVSTPPAQRRQGFGAAVVGARAQATRYRAYSVAADRNPVFGCTEVDDPRR